MWFSPLKGAHLTLGQLDKTLPVDTSVAANKKIERGSFVYIKATAGGNVAAGNPRFELYTDTEAQVANAVPYIALMGVEDFQAGMAGTVGQAPSVTGGTSATGDNLTFLDVGKVVPAVAGPKITAISVVQPAEYQTTAFDATKTYYVGQPLSIDNGVLVPFKTGRNIVGYVTAAKHDRWVNDLNASVAGARISGGTATVIDFSTAWIPAAATSSGTGTPASGDNVKPLNVKAEAPASAGKPATPAK